MVAFDPSELCVEGAERDWWSGVPDFGTVYVYPGTFVHEVISIDVPEIEPEGRLLWHRGDFVVRMMKVPVNHLRTKQQIRVPVASAEAAIGGTPLQAGREIYERFGCEACHGDPEIAGTAVVGPDLSALSEATVATRTVNKDVESYIKESIVDPNAVLAKDCPNGPCEWPSAMPSFREVISERDLASLVGYLLSVRGAGQRAASDRDDSYGRR